MPMIEVSEELYASLRERAARLGESVERMIHFTIARDFPDGQQELWRGAFEKLERGEKEHDTREARRMELLATLERAEARAARYPAGFEVDCSREVIYEGCGEIRE
jgi:hypothetical protein